MSIQSESRGPPTGSRGPYWFGLFWPAPAMSWQTAFFIAPLCLLVAITFWKVANFQLSADFTTANWVSMFTAGYFWDAFLYTLFLAAVTTVLISIIAFPCAYALAFKVSPATRRLGVFFLLTPFFTSFIVRVYSWQVILSNDGILNSGFEVVGLGPFNMLNNSFSTIVGFFTLAFPLVILLHLLSLANVDRSLIEAAHNLRCGRVMTVFLIIIPAARVGLTLAACFAFLLSFGEYLSPSLLGGSRPPTLSVLLVDTVKSGNHWPKASVIAITMIVTLTLILFAAVKFAYHKSPGASRD